MNSNIKPLISLSNINSLPDGHVHSKISFLKSIINEEQNPQIRQMKERMFKLTYTVKNIGIHGQQIGITSKRVPLKEKQDYIPSEVATQKRKQIFIKKYLPQNSFFAQPLVAIKKQKTQQQQKFQSYQKSFLLDVSRINQNEYSQTRHINSQSKFSKKAFNKPKLGNTFLHSSKFNTVKTDRNYEKQEKVREDLQRMKKSYSQQQLPQKRFQNRKSFAKLLNECGNLKKQEVLLPLQHQQNPLFKKIKKLKQVSAIKTIDKYEQYRSSRTFTQIPSQSKNRYQPHASIIEREVHRRTISKNM